jgi:hypothetical protein
MKCILVGEDIKNLLVNMVLKTNFWKELDLGKHFLFLFIWEWVIEQDPIWNCPNDNFQKGQLVKSRIVLSK